MAAKKKIGRTKAASLTVPKLELNLPVDAKKAKAIQRCLAKGSLTIKINRVDLIEGRAGDPYIYD